MLLIKERRWIFAIWLLISFQIAMLVNGSSHIRPSEFQQKSTRQLSSSPAPQLRLEMLDKHVVMDNGIIRVTFSSPAGSVAGIRYQGVDNLLEYGLEENGRGYWDIVWSRAGINSYDHMDGASFKVIAQDENQIEISFAKTYHPSQDSGSKLPITIDKRFIMLRGHSGFYSYAIFERLDGWPGVSVGQIRMAFKLHQKLFNYMAISDSRQRLMPTARDRIQGQVLDYKEAVLLTKPANPIFKGEVDDKYQYSKENKDNNLHGWISFNPQVGFWLISPSHECCTGGPLKQELTSHVGPTSLAGFHSSHYAGDVVSGLDFKNGEPWSKVFGPFYVYVNSINSTEDANRALWEDAKRQLGVESQMWPYNFPRSANFLKASQRGTVIGRLLVRDRYINREPFPAKSAYVGLAPPGDPGSWQIEAKGYQFWVETDDKGFFTIRNVRAGIYSLYAWVPGILGDYKYEIDINVTPGSTSRLGNIVFDPPRNGPTLWEIGIPDRSADEFYVPDPYPMMINRLYINSTTDKFRQYGLWDRYTDHYPDKDLIYKVGVSDYRKDWFFAHVNRRISAAIYKQSTWQISFDLTRVNPLGNYTLRVALASTTLAELQVHVNSLDSLQATTGLIGRDNAIARHGIHGLYFLYSFNIPGNKLSTGTNIIFLTQSRGRYKFSGLMYDYIRLEGH